MNKKLELCRKLLFIVESEECIDAEEYVNTYGKLEPRYLGFFTMEQMLIIAVATTIVIFLYIAFH